MAVKKNNQPDNSEPEIRRPYDDEVRDPFEGGDVELRDPWEDLVEKVKELKPVAKPVPKEEDSE